MTDRMPGGKLGWNLPKPRPARPVGEEVPLMEPGLQSGAPFTAGSSPAPATPAPGAESHEGGPSNVGGAALGSHGSGSNATHSEYMVDPAASDSNPTEFPNFRVGPPAAPTGPATSQDARQVVDETAAALD